MEYEKYYDPSDGRDGGIPQVFAGSCYQRGHGIGSFLGGLFRKIFPYLRKGARAVGKEALRAGINVMEDVENDTPLRESLRTRFRESRGNLKRKAEEKIASLMKGSGYKVSAKTPMLQFPLGILDTHVAKRRTSLRKRRPSVKRKSSKSSARRKRTSKKSAKKKKKIHAVGRKTGKSSATGHRRVGTKKRSVSDIFS